MTDDMAAKWADLLVDYCLRVEAGETILVGSELAAWPLISACYKAIVLRGAFPLVRPDFPELSEFFLRNASDTQLQYLPPTAIGDIQTAAGRIRISAETDTRMMSKVDPQKQAMVDRSRKPIREAARGKRWVLTQYPTAAYAADANMSLEDYEAYVVAAMFLDRADPAECWRALGRRQQGILDYMKTAKSVRIEADGTDLTLSVDQRVWINSDGRRNMPSGEIFTGPIETSASGRLRCGFPVCRDGREIIGIELELKDGVVVSAKAEQGEDFLLSMLDIDAGARRLGELGIGLNYGINRFTGSILYDEKIGGTVHLALGQSYPETLGVNESALHWDLIVDTRANGRITVDGQVAMENGQWRVG
jgi:aminopeptidase